MGRHLVLLCAVSGLFADSAADGWDVQTPGDEQAALQIVKKWGGSFKRDEEVKGQPVVEVAIGDWKRGCPATDADLKVICKGLKRLKTLIFDGSRVTDVGLKEVKELKELRKLSLSNTKEVTDIGLKEFKELKELRELWLNWTRVTGSGLKDCKSGRGNLVSLDNFVKLGQNHA